MHIMLMGLKKPLVKGTTIPVRLTFRYAKPLMLNVPVNVGSSASDDHHMHH